MKRFGRTSLITLGFAVGIELIPFILLLSHNRSMMGDPVLRFAILANFPGFLTAGGVQKMAGAENIPVALSAAIIFTVQVAVIWTMLLLAAVLFRSLKLKRTNS